MPDRGNFIPRTEKIVQKRALCAVLRACRHAGGQANGALCKAESAVCAAAEQSDEHVRARAATPLSVRKIGHGDGRSALGNGALGQGGNAHPGGGIVDVQRERTVGEDGIEKVFEHEIVYAAVPRLQLLWGDVFPAVGQKIGVERLEKRYEAVIKEVFAVEDLIAENLAYLSETEQTIIIERYMSGKSWRKIQAELHYEERQPYRIAGSALKKLSAKIKDDSK